MANYFQQYLDELKTLGFETSNQRYQSKHMSTQTNTNQAAEDISSRALSASWGIHQHGSALESLPAEHFNAAGLHRTAASLYRAAGDENMVKYHQRIVEHHHACGFHNTPFNPSVLLRPFQILDNVESVLTAIANATTLAEFEKLRNLAATHNEQLKILRSVGEMILVLPTAK